MTKKSKLALRDFIYMNSNPSMYVLHTRHEHLGSYSFKSAIHSLWQPAIDIRRWKWRILCFVVTEFLTNNLYIYKIKLCFKQQSPCFNWGNITLTNRSLIRYLSLTDVMALRWVRFHWFIEKPFCSISFCGCWRILNWYFTLTNAIEHF